MKKKNLSIKNFLLSVSIIFFLFACNMKYFRQQEVTSADKTKIFITDIKVEQGEKETYVKIYSNVALKYTSFMQNIPPALILDVPDAYIHRNLLPYVFTGQGPIKEIIPEQKDTKEQVKAQFTIKMEEIFPYDISESENILTINISHGQMISSKAIHQPGPLRTDINIPMGINATEHQDQSPALKELSGPSEADLPKKEILRQVLPKARTGKKEKLQKEEKPMADKVTETINVPKEIRDIKASQIQETETAKTQKQDKDIYTSDAVKLKKYEEEILGRIQKEYTGKPITLDFQNADIKSVLRIIADVSGYNLVIDPKVEGKVNISLAKPVPWDQALDVILKSNKFGMKMEGNIIRVGLPDTFKVEKEAEVKIIEAQRKANEEVRKAKPLITKIVSVNYAKAAMLATKISPMLSKGEGLAEMPSVVVDDRTNTLIIKDLPEKVDNILNLIETLDRPTPQVMIEARIVETTRNFLTDLGIQWGGTYSKKTNYRFANTIEVQGGTGTQTGVALENPTGRPDEYAVNLPISSSAFGAIGFNFGHINKGTSLDIQLKAMERSGKIRIVSNPRIATLDNEEASIESGTQIPYQATDADGNPTTSFVSASINLTVTPQITPDNNITMKIRAEKSEPDWSNAVLGAPAISKRSVFTRLIIKDEDTAVIGGLNISNNANQLRKVPVLGDLPLLGHLFKAKDNSESFDEILIFITPKIITQWDLSKSDPEISHMEEK